MAAISVSKAALVAVALWLMLRTRSAPERRWQGWSPYVIAAMLGALLFSTLYSVAPWKDALGDVVKYAKLLLVVFVPYLITTRSQARTAFAFWAAIQVFILASSLALAAGIALPWVTAPRFIETNSVFHEYLHQSIMTASFAAVCWHLRGEWGSPRLQKMSTILAILALVNVMFMLPGRSGYVAALIVMVLGLFWQTRGYWRVATVIGPVAVVAVAFLVSPQFKDRIQLVASEAAAFHLGHDPGSSIAWRLNFWNRSVQAITERPLTGFGSGSWGIEYQRLDAGSDKAYRGHGGNPHQEYLLWGVLLGLGGIALLLALLVALWRDASQLATPYRRCMKTVILIMATIGLFNSVLYDGEIGEFFCWLLGLLLAFARASDNRDSPTSAGART